jgi:hypothetical protein
VSAFEHRARGVLSRRIVRPTEELYIGKESNRLEDVEAGLLHDPSLVLEVYPDKRRGLWERLVRPVLQDIPVRWLVEQSGLSRRTIQRLRNGHSLPRPFHENALTRSAADFARDRLTVRGIHTPPNDLGCLYIYSAANGSDRALPQSSGKSHRQ